MPSTIEEITVSLAESTFFKELCFSAQTFAIPQIGEFELADVFIWLESDGIIIQVKEREECSATDPAGIARWFNKKVVGNGTKQIADTLTFFSEHPSVTVKNSRGVEFELRRLNAARMHKIIVFGTLASNVDVHHQVKLRASERAGIVHLIEAVDFGNLLSWLVTPGEMLEYLQFREQYLHDHTLARNLSEKWLFGRFVENSATHDDRLDSTTWNAESVVENLLDDATQVDLRQFFDYIGTWASESDARDSEFRKLILECAHLSRAAMREFKRRIVKCQERLDKPGPQTLYRLLNKTRDCVFVFGVFPVDCLDRVEIGATTLAQLAKYDCNTSKVVGFFSTPVEPDDVATTPVYIEHPWKANPKLARALREFNPFRPLKKDEIYGYFVNRPDESGENTE